MAWLQGCLRSSMNWPILTYGLAHGLTHPGLTLSFPILQYHLARYHLLLLQSSPNPDFLPPLQPFPVPPFDLPFLQKGRSWQAQFMFLRKLSVRVLSNWEKKSITSKIEKVWYTAYRISTLDSTINKIFTNLISQTLHFFLSPLILLLFLSLLPLSPSENSINNRLLTWSN